VEDECSISFLIEVHTAFLMLHYLKPAKRLSCIAMASWFLSPRKEHPRPIIKSNFLSFFCGIVQKGQKLLPDSKTEQKAAYFKVSFFF